ncbi:hypothetical protein [Ekhidna sp.]|uniref:hypothetical protein n=1 Tax=Ekhidna sp. TaxID=2608089 RepID=UPI003CCC233C
MKLHPFTFLLIFFLSLSNNCLGQEGKKESSDTTLYRIITKDGNQYVGTIQKHNSDTIEFKTSSLGMISISTKQVKSMTEISHEQNGVNGWPYQFQTVNYLTLNSAYGLKKGEGYYQNIWILFNNLSYGVTDNFSIGVGVLSTFLFSDFAPIWVTARLSTPIIENKLNAGGGAVIGTAEGETFGFLYGVTTVGPRDKNISLGAGSGFVNGEFSEIFLNIDGVIRVSKNFYLMMENYLIDNELLTFIGARSIIGRSSLEYGIMRTGNADAIGLPILGVTIPLHK